MSYEIFNKETIWNRRGKPPVLRFSQNGHIRFSVEAIRILGLSKDTPISFMIDRRDEDVVYFFVDKENGMPLWDCTKGKNGVGLQVCCRPLALKVLSFMGLKKNITFDITTDKCKTQNGEMWFVRKDKIHQPVIWRKEGKKIIKMKQQEPYSFAKINEL